MPLCSMKLVWSRFAGSVCDDDHGCSGDNGGSPDEKEPQARIYARGWSQFVALNVRLLGLGSQGVSGDGVAAQPWPNILFLSYDLLWGCDRRHKVDDDQLPGPSRLIARQRLG